jgi:hypothetical protein
VSTIPANFTTEIGTRGARSHIVWVEIAGIPYAFGTETKAASWFTPRASAADEFEGILPWFPEGEVPRFATRDLDQLDGSLSLGQMTFSIVDVDERFSGYMATRRTALRTTLAGTSPLTASSLSGWATSGVAYVGREAIKYTGISSNTLTGETRGAYRTTEGTYAGPVTNTTGATRGGEPIAPFPMFFEGREVWCYWGVNAAAAADCIPVFAGTIRKVSFDKLGRTIKIECDDSVGLLNAPAFRDVGTFGQPENGRLIYQDLFYESSAFKIRATTVGGPVLSYGVIANAASVSLRVGRLLLQTSTAGVNAASGSAEIEILALRPMQARLSLTESELDSAAAGDPLVEVALLTKPSTDTDDWRYYVASQAGNHPLQIALQIMTSVVGDTANGSYDVMRAGWGLGIPEARVDVARFEALIERTPSLRVDFAIDKPIPNFREWAVGALFQPFGFFLSSTLDAKISVGAVSEPAPDDLTGLVTMTEADIYDQGDWQSDLGDAVRQLEWSDDPEMDDAGKLDLARTFSQFDVTDFDAELYPQARDITIESPGTHSGSRWLVPSGLDGRDYAARLRGIYTSRFSGPGARISLKANLKFATLEPGDLFKLTVGGIPNRFLAARGLTASVVEVVSRQPDLSSDPPCVELVVRQSGLGNVLTRYVSPSCILTAWNSGTLTLTCEYSTAAIEPAAFGRASPVASILIWRSDLSASFGPVDVASAGVTAGDEIVLASAPGGYTWSSGDVLEITAYQTAGDNTDLFAFGADSGELLDTADAPHVFQ